MARISAFVGVGFQRNDIAVISGQILPGAQHGINTSAGAEPEVAQQPPEFLNELCAFFGRFDFYYGLSHAIPHIGRLKLDGLVHFPAILSKRLSGAFELYSDGIAVNGGDRADFLLWEFGVFFYKDDHGITYGKSFFRVLHGVSI